MKFYLWAGVTGFLLEGMLGTATFGLVGGAIGSLLGLVVGTGTMAFLTAHSVDDENDGSLKKSHGTANQ